MSESDEDRLSICGDLVSVKRWEPFVVGLFQRHAKGDWIQVHNLCEEVGITLTGIRPELVVAWLDDPFGDEGYAVIIFYDDETKQSLAAHYNRARLLGISANGPADAGG